MYPRINELVRILHGHEISSFLVTNAQFPDAIRLVIRSCCNVICKFSFLRFLSFFLHIAFLSGRRFYARFARSRVLLAVLFLGEISDFL